MGQTVNLSSSDRLGALPSGRTFSMFLYTDWEMLNRQRTLYENRE
nr:MAG TPA: hypothetical protein [Caudoviricetes sp.]